MKRIMYTCDMCGKTMTNNIGSYAYWCHMSFAKYDSHGYTTTQDMDVCSTCLKQLKKMFEKNKTASGKERPEAEA